jgi:general secretion pathway protein J
MNKTNKTPATPVRQSAFTLLEMVIAIGIFAVIATICYAALNQFVITRETLDQRHRTLAELNLAFTLLERDLRFLQPRIVRDGLGESEAALLADSDELSTLGEVLRWTTSVPDYEQNNNQSLQRIALRLEGDELFRISWQVLDRDHDSVESRRRILQGVDSFAVNFFHYDAEAALTSTENWTDSEKLPAGLEILITLHNGREYRRVLEVANGS